MLLLYCYVIIILSFVIIIFLCYYNIKLCHHNINMLAKPFYHPKQIMNRITLNGNIFSGISTMLCATGCKISFTPKGGRFCEENFYSVIQIYAMLTPWLPQNKDLPSIIDCKFVT